jgi:hypothetical protein
VTESVCLDSKCQADMIVLGRMAALCTLLTSFVAEQVVRHSSCSLPQGESGFGESQE